jgi:hypothetical protein
VRRVGRGPSSVSWDPSKYPPGSSEAFSKIPMPLRTLPGPGSARVPDQFVPARLRSAPDASRLISSKRAGSLLAMIEAFSRTRTVAKRTRGK